MAPGSAEASLGEVLKNKPVDYWDKLAIRTKAGCGVRFGPCGGDGSRKCLLVIWVRRDQNLQGLEKMKLAVEKLEAINHIVIRSNEEC